MGEVQMSEFDKDGSRTLNPKEKRITKIVVFPSSGVVCEVTYIQDEKEYVATFDNLDGLEKFFPEYARSIQRCLLN